jgi:hypothetical protein
MTVAEMAALINKRAEYYVRDLMIEMTIVDVRTRFGTVDVKITPVTGSGATWVALSSISTVN